MVVSVIALMSAYTTIVTMFVGLDRDVKAVDTRLQHLESTLNSIQSTLETMSAHAASSQNQVHHLAGQVLVLNKESCPVCQKRTKL